MHRLCGGRNSLSCDLEQAEWTMVWEWHVECPMNKQDLTWSYMIKGALLSDDDQTNLVFFPLILGEEKDLPELRAMSGNVCHCDLMEASTTFLKFEML